MSKKEDRFVSPKVADDNDDENEVVSPDEVVDDVDSFVPSDAKNLTAAEAETIRNTPISAMRKTDTILSSALDAFFENRIDDFDRILKENAYTDPFIACGAALLDFLRCALSMEEQQNKIALAQVMSSSHYSSQLYSKAPNMVSRGFSRLGGWFSSAKSSDPTEGWMRPMEFRAKAVHSLSQLLLCFVLFLQQSVTSVIKGGFALRRAYTELSSLQKEYEARRSHWQGALKKTSLTEEELGLDWNSVHAVGFGLGSLKIMLSLLPESSTSLMSFLGFEGDRRQGERLLQDCFDSRTLLAPLASLVLLSVYGMLPSSCALLVDSCVPVGRRLGEESLALPHVGNSIFHLWLVARIDRLERNLDASMGKIQTCLAVGEDEQVKRSFPQLPNFALYDLTFNNIITLNWEEAARSFQRLGVETKWSPLFYAYAEACCVEMMSLDPDLSPDDRRSLRCRAAAGYWRAALKKRTMSGGKVMHVDRLVIRRMEELMTAHGVAAHPNPEQKKEVPFAEKDVPSLVTEGEFLNTIPLPAYELLILFSLSHLIPAKPLEKLLKVCTTQLEEELRQVNYYNLSTDERHSFQAITETFFATPLSPTTSAVIVPPTTKKSSTSKKEKAAQLPALYRLYFMCGLVCVLTANSPSSDDWKKALPLIDGFLKTTPFKETSQTLSYLHPWALYELIGLNYKLSSETGVATAASGPSSPSNANSSASGSSRREQCEKLVAEFKKKYDGSKYFFHFTMDFKIHLLAMSLRLQKEDAEREKKENAGALATKSKTSKGESRSQSKK